MILPEGSLHTTAADPAERDSLLDDNTNSSASAREQSLPHDDENERPRKRRRTSEPSSEQYPQWLLQGSEGDAAAVAAQLEEESTAARTPSHVNVAEEGNAAAVQEGELQTGAEGMGVLREFTPKEPCNSTDNAETKPRMVESPVPDQATAQSVQAPPVQGVVLPSPRQEAQSGVAITEAAPAGRSVDIDVPADVEMDDAASVSSHLSVGFDEDFFSDLTNDLETLLNTFQATTSRNVVDEYSDPRIVTGFSRQETRNLRHTLRKWLELDQSARQTNIFFHRLDQVYNGELSASKLIFRDMALIMTFLQLVEEIPIEIFLAPLDRALFDASCDFISGDWIIANKLVDMDGRLIVQDVPVGRNLLCPGAPPHSAAYTYHRTHGPPPFEAVSDPYTNLVLCDLTAMGLGTCCCCPGRPCGFSC